MKEVKTVNEAKNHAKAAKIIAIIVFSLVMSALTTVIITDIALFSNQILSFFMACLASAFVFLFACIFMVVSFMLVFGFYLTERDGFWPAKWASQAFNSVLEDAKVTPQQLQALLAVRTVILVVCFVAFVASIVSLSLAKAAKKKNPEIKQKLTKTFSILALIFSIFGVFAALVIILILK